MPSLRSYATATRDYATTLAPLHQRIADLHEQLTARTGELTTAREQLDRARRALACRDDTPDDQLRHHLREALAALPEHPAPPDEPTTDPE